MLASVFLVGGINALRTTKAVAPKVEPLASLASKAASQNISAQTLVRANAGAQLVGGAALATGRFPRLSAFLLAGSLAPTTAIGHQFWNQSDPAARKNQLLHFVKNLAIIGGLLMATLDPEPHKKFIGTRAKRKVVEAKVGLEHQIDKALN